jgi:hypothetical protein
MIVIGGTKEVRRELVGVDDEQAALSSRPLRGEHQRGACRIRSVVADHDRWRGLS